MTTSSAVFVINASRLNLSEQETATIAAAALKTVMAEIAKLTRSVDRGLDIDKIVDPLSAARGFGGIAGGVIGD